MQLLNEFGFVRCVGSRAKAGATGAATSQRLGHGHRIHARPPNTVRARHRASRMRPFSACGIVSVTAPAGGRVVRGRDHVQTLNPKPLQVDVWSVGVIMYKMLFGKLPFGDGCSQESILREEVMLNAKTVAFPTKPAVSQDAKDFISKCGRVECTRSAPCLLGPLI
jgi:serine/threonine protein kinase